MAFFYEIIIVKNKLLNYETLYQVMILTIHILFKLGRDTNCKSLFNKKNANHKPLGQPDQGQPCIIRKQQTVVRHLGSIQRRSTN